MTPHRVVITIIDFLPLTSFPSDITMEEDDSADAPSHLRPLVNGFKRLYNSKNFADVTIICQGVEFKAHKVVLCAQSEVFQKMLGGS